jgi:hypothetical protein
MNDMLRKDETVIVRAFRNETGGWTAVCERIGLATEAFGYNDLIEKVKASSQDLIEAMLESNQGSEEDFPRNIPIRIQTESVIVVCV